MTKYGQNMQYNLIVILYYFIVNTFVFQTQENEWICTECLSVCLCLNCLYLHMGLFVLLALSSWITSLQGYRPLFVLMYLRSESRSR
jgi:hypothetical protein